jgi:hypothetical protein
MRKMKAKKRIIIVALLAVLALAACSEEKVENQAINQTAEEDSVQEETVKVTPEPKESATPAFENDNKQEVKEDDIPKEDIPEVYSKVVEENLDGKCYALVDLGLSEKCLLISDGPFDFYDGVKGAVTSEVYGVDSEGNVIEFGLVQSDGSGYLLAVETPYLYVSGGHHIDMLQPNVKKGTLDVYEGARIEYTETTDMYYYTKDSVETEVDDISGFDELFNRRSDKGQIINFYDFETNPGVGGNDGKTH